MQYRRLGRSGLEVSVVGLGCNNFGWRIDAAATERVVGQALDSGINFFDSADVYGPGESEEFLGRALRGRRHEAVVATKFGIPMGQRPMQRGTSRRYIVEAVEASLRRLDTDYIDLYQIHRPDPNTPIEETIRALDDLVSAGKVRYLGHSALAGWQIADADWTARASHRAPFISAQNPYSLLDRAVEDDVIPACRAFGLGFLPYYPLASGMLTGKYRTNRDDPTIGRLSDPESTFSKHMFTDENHDRVEALGTFAEARGHTLVQLAFSWLAQQPQVGSVIAGATSPEQVRENAEAVAWELSAEDVEEIDGITR